VIESAHAGFLLSGFDHGAAVEIDRGLREQPSVDRRPCSQRDRGLGQDDTLAMRRRAEIHETGDLPEDILGLCSTCQEDLRAAAHGEILGDLEIQTSLAVPVRVTSVGIRSPVPHW